MDMVTGMAHPKPEPRQRVKGRKDRAESAVKQQARAACVLRDGDCRFHGVGLGDCDGESEWCHLNEYVRSKTRGQAPDKRHTTYGSLMACTHHHDQIDYRKAPRLFVSFGPKGCDGVLTAWYAALTRHAVRVPVKEQAA